MRECQRISKEELGGISMMRIRSLVLDGLIGYAQERGVSTLPFDPD